MTRQEKIIIENETRDMITQVRCPKCDIFINEKSATNHLAEIHNFKNIPVRWSLGVPEITVEPYLILVQFSPAMEIVAEEPGQNIGEVVQNYYDMLLIEYNRHEVKPQTVNITQKEKEIVENETKDTVTVIRCPECDKVFKESSLTKHLNGVHSYGNIPLKWTLLKPKITIGQDIILVEFSPQIQQVSNGLGEDIKDVVQRYYEILLQKYTALFGAPQTSEDPGIVQVENRKEPVSFQGEHELVLIWDHIIFQKDRITFNHPRHIIQPVEIRGILPEINVLKKDYFQVKHNILLKFKVVNGIIDRENSTGLNKILELIDLSRNIPRMSFETEGKDRFKIASIEGMSNSDIIAKYTSSKTRTFYIRHLAGLQSSSHQIVPVIEQRGSKKEVSFIFTVVRGSQLLLVWENCSTDRGMHIFEACRENVQDVMNTLKSYITDPQIPYKRKVLWRASPSAAKLRQRLNHRRSLKHSDPEKFIMQMKYL